MKKKSNEMKIPETFKVMHIKLNVIKQVLTNIRNGATTAASTATTADSLFEAFLWSNLLKHRV